MTQADEFPRIVESPYKALFEKSPEPHFVLDPVTFRILAVNEAVQRIYGFSLRQLLDMTYLDLTPPEDGVRIRDEIAQMGRAGSSGGEWRNRTRYGAMRFVLAKWVSITFANQPAILMSVTSSTRVDAAPNGRQQYRASPISMAIQTLRETEYTAVTNQRDQLETLAHRLVELQEAERREVARELHDEIGQLATALKLTLSSIVDAPHKANGKTPSANGSHFPELMRIADELLMRVRDLSMSLRPPMLDEMGLYATLHWYFERFTARTGIRVNFRRTGPLVRYPVRVETSVFRIVQEALTNVARHANVQDAEVEISSSSSRLRVVIRDFGVGFNRVVTRSAGLTGIRERAMLLGGTLTIDSARGEGTRLTVEFPLGFEQRT